MEQCFDFEALPDGLFLLDTKHAMRVGIGTYGW